MNAGQMQYMDFLGHTAKSFGIDFSSSMSLLGAEYL